MHASGVASDTRFISTGVPQGSILGPLLFTNFINDLPKSSTFFSTRLYADDTSLTASGSDLDSLLREINNHLPAVYKWLCSNQLTLNLTKTNTPFTPAKHVLLNWFSLNENYKQRTEKLDFPLDSSTC